MTTLPSVNLAVLGQAQTRRAMALVLARALFPHEGPQNLVWVAKYIETGHRP